MGYENHYFLMSQFFHISQFVNLLVKGLVNSHIKW